MFARSFCQTRTIFARPIFKAASMKLSGAAPLVQAGRGTDVTSDDVSYYAKNGFVKFENVFNVDEVSGWVDEISKWPKSTNKWLVHWEASDVNAEGKQFCRAENFVAYHDGMKELSDLVGDIVGKVTGSPAILFKEKINYKLPGGSGFAAHQDSPAYLDFCDDHVSAMVMVDACTDENGALEVVSGKWSKQTDVPLTESGIITPEAEAEMDFKKILGNPGDVVLFHGWTPHRSTCNSSGIPRRAIFLTYNRSADGDFHTPYYEAKHKGAEGFDSSKTISFQGDFQGKIVD